MLKKINEPVSSISHFIGAFLSIPVGIALIGFGALYTSVLGVIAFAIFSVSLFLLYSASTTYHLIPKTPSTEKIKYIARKVDHMMIFVLIAGTYTPICLIALRGTLGYAMAGIVWAIAIGGIVFKALVMNDSKIVRMISTSFYLAMGWLIIFAIYPLAKQLDTISLVLLALGGLSYTIGAVIYALKKPKIPVDWLGFHDIFHFFVLLGSFFHVAMMFTII